MQATRPATVQPSGGGTPSIGNEVAEEPGLMLKVRVPEALPGPVGATVWVVPVVLPKVLGKVAPKPLSDEGKVDEVPGVEEVPPPVPVEVEGVRLAAETEAWAEPRVI